MLYDRGNFVKIIQGPKKFQRDAGGIMTYNWLASDVPAGENIFEIWVSSQLSKNSTLRDESDNKFSIVRGKPDLMIENIELKESLVQDGSCFQYGLNITVKNIGDSTLNTPYYISYTTQPSQLKPVNGCVATVAIPGGDLYKKDALAPQESKIYPIYYFHSPTTGDVAITVKLDSKNEIIEYDEGNNIINKIFYTMAKNAGDVNNDSNIDCFDYAALDDMYLGKTSATASSDVNGDSVKANIADMQKLQNILALGGITSCPLYNGCIDSDGGRNYYKKGYAIGPTLQTNSVRLDDECFKNKKSVTMCEGTGCELREAECYNLGGKGTAGTISYQDKNLCKKCQYGVCVE